MIKWCSSTSHRSLHPPWGGDHMAEGAVEEEEEGAPVRTGGAAGLSEEAVGSGRNLKETTDVEDGKMVVLICKDRKVCEKGWIILALVVVLVQGAHCGVDHMLFILLDPWGKKASKSKGGNASPSGGTPAKDNTKSGKNSLVVGVQANGVVHPSRPVCNSSEFYDIAFKVMLVGDSGVGKTCLLVRFKDGAFLAGSFISTVGIDFRVN
ncbi:hypothetical protein P4O66_000638 [Electrophorus voltai]|uniref:RAB26, member RAS oncogene family n=1 Tax=Electrophorus voltai TaxID=2609070 RepID=A0AAD8ZFN0_9TELE|nr:hypothetical protein P4O66_000638 [Electrophorus voltai]